MNNNYSILLSVLVLLTVSSTVTAAAKPVTFEVHAERDYGYTLGDEIELQVDIKSPSGYKLKPGFIQQPGPINNWLILKSFRLSDDLDHVDYRLHLVYQLFKVEKNSIRLQIPPLPINFVKGNRQISLNTPAWSFNYQPLIGGQVTEQQLQIQPAMAPPLLDASPLYPLLIVLILISLILSAYLAWVYDKLPLLRNYSGYFGLACRQLSQLVKQPENNENLQQAMKIFHHALNEYAGSTLFLDQLDDFYQQHPALLPTQKETRLLFESSQRLFFAQYSTQHQEQQLISIKNIHQLCQTYRKISRAGKWI